MAFDISKYRHEPTVAEFLAAVDRGEKWAVAQEKRDRRKLLKSLQALTKLAKKR